MMRSTGFLSIVMYSKPGGSNSWIPNGRWPRTQTIWALSSSVRCRNRSMSSSAELSTTPSARVRPGLIPMKYIVRSFPRGIWRRMICRKVEPAAFGMWRKMRRCVGMSRLFSPSPLTVPVWCRGSRLWSPGRLPSIRVNLPLVRNRHEARIAARQLTCPVVVAANHIEGNRPVHVVGDCSVHLAVERNVIGPCHQRQSLDVTYEGPSLGYLPELSPDEPIPQGENPYAKRGVKREVYFDVAERFRRFVGEFERGWRAALGPVRRGEHACYPESNESQLTGPSPVGASSEGLALSSFHAGQVLRNDIPHVAFRGDSSSVQEVCHVAQALDHGEVVADEDDRPAFTRGIFHLPETLPLKRDVADREDFVDQKDVGLQVCGDRKSQPDPHPGRVPLDRRIDELSSSCEVDDFLEPVVDLCPPHPEDGSVEVDVLASREFRMEPGPDLEEGTQSPPNFCVTFRWLRDSR